MKIVTMNNHGTAHLLYTSHRTLCGRRYPGVEGELTHIGPSAAYPDDGELHLCGKCQEMLEAGKVPKIDERHRNAMHRQTGLLLRAL